MADLNRVCLLGRMGKDPEKRFFPSGDPIVSFSVATSEKWKDKTSGDQRERVEWHRCEATGRVAKFIEEYGFKGQRVYLEGKKVTESFDKDGQKVELVKIKIDDFNGRFDGLTYKDSETQQSAPAPRQERQAQKPAPKPAPRKAANGGWGDEEEEPPPF